MAGVAAVCERGRKLTGYRPGGTGRALAHCRPHYSFETSRPGWAGLVSQRRDSRRQRYDFHVVLAGETVLGGSIGDRERRNVRGNFLRKRQNLLGCFSRGTG